MTASTKSHLVNSKMVVYTIGHSNHSIDHFIGLLTNSSTTAIADVRSVPYSRYNPQFDLETLADALKAVGIAYSFLGKELGARPDLAECYKNGTAIYELIAATQLFRSGLNRVIEGAGKYKLALMCAEKEPLDCHRTILVGRALSKHGVTIRHIHEDGSIEESEAAENRLVKMTKQEMDDLFQLPETGTDPVERAYDVRSQEIAYTDSNGPVGS